MSTQRARPREHVQDISWREILGHKTAVEELLRGFVSEAAKALACLDFEDARQLKTSFVEMHARDLCSDVPWKTPGGKLSASRTPFGPDGGSRAAETRMRAPTCILSKLLDRQLQRSRIHTMKRRLGNLERQLFAHAQMRGLRALGTGDLLGPLRISAKQERELYSRLSRSGMLAQVRRGLYLVPSRLPLGGIWTPGEALTLNALMKDQGGRYQICGPNAFNRYGFDEQVPTRVYAYNNRISGERTVGSVTLSLIKVADGRLGGIEAAKTPDGETMVYSSRARTLVDAVYDWSRFDGLPRAYVWIRDALTAKRVRAPELVDLTLRYGNQGTIRRMGVLLERVGVSDSLLRRLARHIRRTSGLIPWIPGRPRRGAVSRRWGVVVNGEL